MNKEAHEKHRSDLSTGSSEAALSSGIVLAIAADSTLAAAVFVPEVV
jgi:hypothetical protein